MKRRVFGNKKGFTLVEVIVVLLILAILSSIVIPSLTGYIDDANAKVCLVNRQQIVRMADSAVIVEEDLPAALAAANGDSAKIRDALWATGLLEGDSCPSGGEYVYSYDAATMRVSIQCTVHDGVSGGGSGSGGTGTATYPGTSAAVGSSYWPQDSDYANSWDTIDIKAGGIFQYSDGGYYVVTQDLSLTKAQAASGPGGTVYAWFATQKLTGTVYTSTSFGTGQRGDLRRGDLYTDSTGACWVFQDGGSWGYAPAASPGQWYKLP